MGQNRVELLTPALSEQCSNRQSYWPKKREKGRVAITLTGYSLENAYAFSIRSFMQPVGCFVKLQACKRIWDMRHIVARPFGHVLKLLEFQYPFKVKGGDPAALSSTATLLRLHPPY